MLILITFLHSVKRSVNQNCAIGQLSCVYFPAGQKIAESSALQTTWQENLESNPASLSGLPSQGFPQSQEQYSCPLMLPIILMCQKMPWLLSAHTPTHSNTSALMSASWMFPTGLIILKWQQC